MFELTYGCVLDLLNLAVRKVTHFAERDFASRVFWNSVTKTENPTLVQNFCQVRAGTFARGESTLPQF